MTFSKYSLYLPNHLQQVWNVYGKKLQGIFRLKKEGSSKADDNLGFRGSPLLSPVSNVARRWNFVGQMVSTMSMAVTCRCCRDFRRRLEPPRGPLATLSPTRSTTTTTTWITRISPWGPSACYTQWFSRETASWSQLPFQSYVAPEKKTKLWVMHITFSFFVPSCPMFCVFEVDTLSGWTAPWFSDQQHTTWCYDNTHRWIQHPFMKGSLTSDSVVLCYICTSDVLKHTGLLKCDKS